MKKILLLAFLSGFISTLNAQGSLCNTADPFCAGNSAYTFPAGVNSGSGQPGPNYGCLTTRPNPAWYYMQVSVSGNIEFEITTTPHRDIDFICWGPFTSATLPCVAQLTGDVSSHGSHHSQGPGGGYPTFNTIDCSYDPSWQEWCYLPNAVVGQYYILLITNYSNAACNISFSQSAGTGSTSCAILPPIIGSNSPVCEGSTLQLTANLIPNAQYVWTGPNGFTSNSQNPTITNVSPLNAGIYTCNFITVNGSSPSSSITVTVVPKPLSSAINHN